MLLFTQYFWAFEVTSALLITAAVGAMVLTHRERAEPRKSQRELSPTRERWSKGRAGSPPLPAPGRLRAAQRGRHPGAAARRLVPSDRSASRATPARSGTRCAAVRHACRCPAPRRNGPADVPRDVREHEEASQ